MYRIAWRVERAHADVINIGKHLQDILIACDNRADNGKRNHRINHGTIVRIDGDTQDNREWIGADALIPAEVTYRQAEYFTRIERRHCRDQCD